MIYNYLHLFTKNNFKCKMYLVKKKKFFLLDLKYLIWIIANRNLIFNLGNKKNILI